MKHWNHPGVVIVSSNPYYKSMGRKVPKLELASGDFDAHCNVLMPNEGINHTFDPADMKKLRDELITLYPLPVAAPVEAPTPTKKANPKGAQAYKGNGKHEWETVSMGGSRIDTERLRVPSGWLYRTDHHAVTFVPMPEVVGYAI